MDVIDTFMNSTIPAENHMFMIVLMIVQALIWLFKLYVVIRIIIACNIYIKKNKKETQSKDSDYRNE